MWAGRVTLPNRFWGLFCYGLVKLGLLFQGLGLTSVWIGKVNLPYLGLGLTPSLVGELGLLYQGLGLTSLLASKVGPALPESWAYFVMDWWCWAYFVMACKVRHSIPRPVAYIFWAGKG